MVTFINLRDSLFDYVQWALSYIKEAIVDDKIEEIWKSIHTIERKIEPKVETFSVIKFAVEVVLPVVISEGVELALKRIFTFDITQELLSGNKSDYLKGLSSMSPEVIKLLPKSADAVTLKKIEEWIDNTFENAAVKKSVEQVTKQAAENGFDVAKAMGVIKLDLPVKGKMLPKELSDFGETAADALGAITGDFYSLIKTTHFQMINKYDLNEIDDSGPNTKVGEFTISMLNLNGYILIDNLYTLVFEIMHDFKNKLADLLIIFEGIPFILASFYHIVRNLYDTNASAMRQFYRNETQAFLNIYKKLFIFSGYYIYGAYYYPFFPGGSEVGGADPYLKKYSERNSINVFRDVFAIKPKRGEEDKTDVFPIKKFNHAIQYLQSQLLDIYEKPPSPYFTGNFEGYHDVTQFIWFDLFMHPTKKNILLFGLNQSISYTLKGHLFHDNTFVVIDTYNTESKNNYIFTNSLIKHVLAARKVAPIQIKEDDIFPGQPTVIVKQKVRVSNDFAPWTMKKLY